MVEIVMERDEDERTVEAPALLKGELAKSKTAAANWRNSLTATRKRWCDRWLTRNRLRLARGASRR